MHIHSNNYRSFSKTHKVNIPILPEAFLTFASKSSVGPSYVTIGQEDHKTYNLNENENDNENLKPAQTLKRPPLREGPNYGSPPGGNLAESSQFSLVQSESGFSITLTVNSRCIHESAD